MLLHSSRSNGNIDADTSILTERTEKKPYTLKWRRMHNAVYRFNFRPAQNKGLEFWKTITNAIILCDSMPAGFLIKVLKRNFGRYRSRDSV